MHMIRRRRREGLTDYSRRIELLKSGMARLIARKSNRGIRMQIVEYWESGDKTVAQASSNELKQFGWSPRRNTPTAYLTGALLARKAKALQLKECVLDIGITKPTRASVLFAAAKGAIDSGLKVRNGIEFDADRLRGRHIGDYIGKADKGSQFSLYRKNGYDAAKMEELFNKVKGTIGA